KAVQAGTIKPAIIVAAYDPTHFSMWTDSADGTSNQASAVIHELLPYVESTYHVQPERRSRFLQGFSMGGFGAATLGLKHQDLFGAITIWDGALHNWDTLNRGRPKIATNQFSNDEQHFDDWSPWTWAERADLTRTPILIISGLMVDFADRYTRHLTQLGANLTRKSADCFHDLRCLERTYGQRAFQFLAKT
ncbi:MAG: hypothetical protein GY773_15170, partial [Actinomycetia bacterium]|nr:hypothetical protein [Actinomycetes bacterium]